MSQQEAHSFSPGLSNHQSIEVPGQHWSMSLYRYPTRAYWSSQDTIPTAINRTNQKHALLSLPSPPACQWKHGVKGLGQARWKHLCPQAHWHVYHLPEFHIKREGGGVTEALNEGLSIVSEYERRRLRRQNQSRSDEWAIDGFGRWALRESAAFERVEWLQYGGLTVVIIITDQRLLVLFPTG